METERSILNKALAVLVLVIGFLMVAMAVIELVTR